MFIWVLGYFKRPAKGGGRKFSTHPEGGAKNFQHDLFFSTHQNSTFSSVYMGFGEFSIFRSKGGRKFFNGPRRGGEKFSTRPEGGGGEKFLTRPEGGGGNIFNLRLHVTKARKFRQPSKPRR